MSHSREDKKAIMLDNEKLSSMLAEFKIDLDIKLFNNIDIERLDVKPVTLSFDYSSVGFFKRSPEEYKEITLKNEKVIGRLPDDLWLMVFNFLDTPAVIMLIVTCKKFAGLRNDDEISKRLNCARESHNSQKNIKKLVNSMFDMTERNIVSFPTQRAPQVYNDNPPNKGFVIL